MHTHCVRKVSCSGSTAWVDTVFFDINSPKTYASSVLLKNYYWERDAENMDTLANVYKRIEFSRRYLLNVQKEFGTITCTYCPKTNLQIELMGMKVPHNQLATVDHIIAISKGGSVFDVKNVVPCCGKCNRAKGNMTVEEFLIKRNDIFGYLKYILYLCSKLN